MAKAVATMLGLLIGAHGILSLFVEGRLLLTMFNADVALDVVYLVTALVLLVAGAPGVQGRSTVLVLAVMGVIYAALGVFGLIDDHFAGILPTGLTFVDLIFFFAVAGTSLLVAALPGSQKPLENAGSPVN